MDSSGAYLFFRRITIPDLKSAVKSAYEMVRLKFWKKKEGVSYLETFAIASDYVDAVCSSADTDIPLPPFPHSWNIDGVDIRHHIDVPMHLMFLGITKANATDLVGSWLKALRKQTSFCKKSRPLLQEIANVGVSWCKAEISFGGYVSENWIAYARLHKYVYQLLSMLAVEDKEYEDPVKPMSQYKLTEKRAWLCAREVDGITKRSKKEVVDEKFSEYMEMPADKRPAIVKPIASNASLEEVENMVICWQVCVCRIMFLSQAPTSENIENIDRHIKIFLSSVHDFDRTRWEQETGGGRNVPKWRMRPNYLGLLNIPSAIQEMGPIRMLSELDLKGEAHIKWIKNKINSGHVKDWAYNAMARYYCERSFRYTLKDCALDCQKRGSTTGSSYMVKVASQMARRVEGDDENHQKEFNTFSGQREAIESLQHNRFVSGVVSEDRLYLVVRGKRYLEIKPAVYEKSVCGADYFAYVAVAPIANVAPAIGGKEYFMLLPVLNGNGDRTTGSFYLITSAWREMVKSDEGFLLKLPEIPKAEYR